MQHIYLIFFVFLSYTMTLNGQTFDSTKTNINTTKPINKDSVIQKKPSWFYSASLDGTASSGNVNRQLINFKSTLSFENPRYLFGFFTNPKFQYGNNSGFLQEREIFLDLNSTFFYLQQNVYLLAFGAFEQSNIRKITTRYNIGLGIGWKISGGKKNPKSKLKISITNALVKEVTDYEVKQDVYIYRNSTRFKLSLSIIPDKFSFNYVAFIQPSLIDNYFRWNSSSQLSYKVGKHLAILASFENTYENYNIFSIQNSQTNTTFGLVYSGSK